MQGFRKKGLKIIVVSLILISFVAGFLTYPLIEKLAIRSVPDEIGTIEIRGYVLYSQDLEYLLKLIDYAKTNSSIKAIVLDIDSGGGVSYAFEQLYYSIRLVSKTKPVVASISGLAASGGYYLAASAEYIYASPTSFVGNIGVVAFMPERVYPVPSIMETGPYKLSGFNLTSFPLQVNDAISNFVNNVKEGRGGRLNASPSTLEKAEIYLGSEAKSIGLIDEVGSIEQAIDKAASLAGITNYKVSILNEIIPNTFPFSTLAISPFSLELNDSFLSGIYPPPAIYCIYSPFLANYQSQPLKQITYPNGLQETNTGEDVIIAYAYRNAFSRDEIESLLTEIILNGHTFSFLTDKSQLQSKLMNAKAFVVIAPTESFSDRENQIVKGFVERGGKLILISSILRASQKEINSLSYGFGIVFSSSYLYNLRSYYGIYRYIFVSNFTINGNNNFNIFKNVSKIVMMTASPIYSSDINEAALTDNGTYSFVSDKTMQYTPIVVSYNGRVVAIGSFEMFTQPFITLYGNEKFEENIVNFMFSG